MTIKSRIQPSITCVAKSQTQLPLFASCTHSQSAEVNLAAQLHHIIGAAAQVQDVVRRYFHTVHLWMPVLNEASHMTQLETLPAKPQASYVLLTLSMALIVTNPSLQSATVETPLYAAVKAGIGLVESASEFSTDLVSAKLLLSLFEFGHGIEPAAYVSIGDVVRTAAAIGVNGRACSDRVGSEEDLRLWWGIVTLDR